VVANRKSEEHLLVIVRTEKDAPLCGFLIFLMEMLTMLPVDSFRQFGTYFVTFIESQKVESGV
jgi:hypothetical protein